MLKNIVKTFVVYRHSLRVNQNTHILTYILSHPNYQ